MFPIKFFLTLLFLPILLVFLITWIIYWKFCGKKQTIQEKTRQEQQKKLLAHIHNFSPTRLKNRRWRSIIKQPKKKPKKKVKP